MNNHDFLLFLSRQHTLISTPALAEQMQVSPGRIYRLLHQVNHDFCRKNIRPLKKNQILNSQQKNALQEQAKNWPNQTIWSTDSRFVLIKLLVTIPNQRWTINRLATFFQVSRNTILRDLAKLRQASPLTFNQRLGHCYQGSRYQAICQANTLIINFDQEKRTWLTKLLQKSKDQPSVRNQQVNSKLIRPTTSKSFADLLTELSQLYEHLVSKTPSAHQLTGVLLLLACFSQNNRFLSQNNQAIGPIFSKKQTERLQIRQEYHVAQRWLTANHHHPLLMPIFPDLTLLLTAQLLSLNKNDDQKAHAEDFQTLTTLSQAIATTLVKQNQWATSTKTGAAQLKNTLATAIQTQLKPFFFASIFSLKSATDYLFCQPERKAQLMNALAQPLVREKLNQIFPHGLQAEQIVILTMIWDHHLQVYQDYNPLAILFLTDLPIYSQHFFLDHLTQGHRPVTVTIKSLATSFHRLDSGEKANYQLILTEDTTLVTKLPVFLIPRIINPQTLQVLDDQVDQLLCRQQIYFNKKTANTYC